MSTILQQNLAKNIVKNVKLGEFGKEVVSPYLKVKKITKKHYKSGSSGVYIIKSGDYYKIGYTKDFARRYDSFQNANPIDPELVFFLCSDFPKEMEGQLHKLVEGKRFKREWFKLDIEDILLLVNFVKETWAELYRQSNAKIN